jgi:hypothetical protein
MEKSALGENSVLRELDGVFDDLETLLKNPDVVAHLADRGVNTSLAMVIADGLRAYLSGKRAEAVEDLSTAVEEIRVRSALLANASRNGPS